MKIDIHNETERGDIITLVEPIVETWKGRAIAVPAGFESDGVSTPRFLWTTVSPKVHPQTIRGGICHDFLYRKQPTGWTRAEADKMFRDFIIADGFNKTRANVAYVGLRLFGGAAWKENRRLNK